MVDDPDHVLKECPDCGRSGFATPHGLMVHRVRAHGFKGDGRKPKPTPSKRRYRSRVCDICDGGPFSSLAALGAHKQKKHGIAGTSRNAVLQHEKADLARSRSPELEPIPALPKSPPQLSHCPECGYDLAQHHGALEIVSSGIPIAVIRNVLETIRHAASPSR